MHGVQFHHLKSLTIVQICHLWYSDEKFLRMFSMYPSDPPIVGPTTGCSSLCEAVLMVEHFSHEVHVSTEEGYENPPCLLSGFLAYILNLLFKFCIIRHCHSQISCCWHLFNDIFQVSCEVYSAVSSFSFWFGPYLSTGNFPPLNFILLVCSQL